MKDLSDSKASASSELANRIFFRLYQAANTMHKTGTKALEKYGVTTQQWSVLGALSRPQAANGMAIGDLCRFLMVSRQNLNGVLDRLGRQGYTTAVTDPADRRSKRIKLTPKGEKIWDAITPLIYSYYDNTLQGFSFDDRVDFLHHLNHLLNNMVKLED
ncbi:MarR family winged helix-turn-helix transcriptional regulator [Ferrovibrio sp.]|uniref:MarR family winged helix-turn-helix transcriptional regulator n=1 Tax=Ferrovibrio sp. TaxID=1917215 RepID=UPI0035ADFFF5